MPHDIILKQMELGPMANFLYLVGDPDSREVAVVDPAWDVDALRAETEREGWTITKVLLTHGHPDHVNGLDDLLSTHDVPVIISKHEAPFFTPDCGNLQKVDHGDRVAVGGVEFEVLHTPGHSPGCQCFRHGDVLIAGDAIFIDGCGRADLPGGDARVMYRSLYDVIMPLPDSVVLYCGHNYGPKPVDTLGGQKQTNPYLSCSSEEEFLRERMGV